MGSFLPEGASNSYRGALHEKEGAKKTTGVDRGCTGRRYRRELPGFVVYFLFLFPLLFLLRGTVFKNHALHIGR